VPALGRILFEPDQVALRAAQRVNKTLCTDVINAANSWLGYPRTDFPFRGKTRLKLAGRWSIINKIWYFQTHRIVECSAAFPFNTLSFCDEISKGGASAKEDAPIAFENIKFHDKGPAHEGSTQGASVSDCRPSDTAKSLSAILGLRTYGGLEKVILTKQKLRDNSYRSQTRINRSMDDLRDASTGKSTSGKSSSVKQTIEEHIFKPSEVTPSLKSFLDALDGLSQTQKDWNIKTIGIGTPLTHDATVIYSYFPSVSCEKQARFRQFSFMDDEKKISRRLICAEIAASDKYVYLFEAQRRPRDGMDGGYGMEHKEPLCILLLHRPGYERQYGKDFIKIIEQTVIGKNWPKANMVRPFIRQDTNHCKVDDSREDYVEKLRKFLIATFN
jgi:hypothetical protein